MKLRNYVSKYLHQFNKASAIPDKRQSKQRVCWKNEAQKELDEMDGESVEYPLLAQEQEEDNYV